jgi:hypothetical protein
MSQSNPLPLTGRIAIVVGGSGGMGKATPERLASLGAINQSINKFMFTRRISEKVSGRRNKFFVDFFGGYALMKLRFF